MNPEEILAVVQDEIKKAAVTNSTYTQAPPSRSIFAPENLDPVVKVLVPVTAPVRRILPRVEGFGQAANWNKITSKLDPQAGSTNTKVGFADASQPNQTSQTTAFVSVPFKNLGRDVEIGRQALATNRGGSIEDMRAKLENIKTIEVLLGEEDMILNGNSTFDTTAFDGLATSITTNSGTAVYLTASGIGSFAQNIFNQGADFPTHLVTAPRQVRALADDLQGSGSIQRIVVDNQGAGVGGVHVSKLVNPVSGNLIDIVTSRYVGGTAYLLTVTSPAGENWIEMEDLEPLSIYDVPDTNHAIQSRIYETTVLKVIGEPFQQKVSGLSLT